MNQELSLVTDKRGRVFRAGEALDGRPGVNVARIRRVGNFVQVDFVRSFEAPVVPQPIVMHIGDVDGMKQA